MGYNKEFRQLALWQFSNTTCSSIVVQDSYRKVESLTGVPAIVVAIIHQLEGNSNFSKHLHNGDPLSGRTTHVPAGRPREGSPPFDWVDSAVDALKCTARRKDWSIPATLYALEGYNGWGYRNRGIASPYIWSKTQYYTRGKYVKDGVFDADAISKQTGAAKYLSHYVNFNKGDLQLNLYKGKKHPDAAIAQRVLFELGVNLLVDGWFGKKSCVAFKEVFGCEVPSKE